MNFNCMAILPAVLFETKKYEDTYCFNRRMLGYANRQ